jgi:hypothetical protein
MLLMPSVISAITAYAEYREWGYSISMGYSESGYAEGH